MTDAEKREKVIKGLELCTSKIETRTRVPCEICPYHNEKYHGVNGDGCCNMRSLQRDMLALLKAQEPRVIDFDDVVGGDECWLEAVNGACGYADCYACTGTGEVQVFRCNFDNPQYIMASDYLKTWRCWTSRPTDEQREAIPWN